MSFWFFEASNCATIIVSCVALLYVQNFIEHLFHIDAEAGRKNSATRRLRENCTSLLNRIPNRTTVSFLRQDKLCNEAK